MKQWNLLQNEEVLAINSAKHLKSWLNELNRPAVSV